MKNITEIIESIKILEGLSKDKEVAKLLEMTSAALSNHKSNGTIPYHNLLLFCHANHVSVDYLLTASKTEKPEEEDTASLKEIIGLQEELLKTKNEVIRLQKLENAKKPEQATC